MVVGLYNTVLKKSTYSAFLRLKFRKRWSYAVASFFLISLTISNTYSSTPAHNPTLIPPIQSPVQDDQEQIPPSPTPSELSSAMPVFEVGAGTGAIGAFPIGPPPSLGAGLDANIEVLLPLIYLRAEVFYGSGFPGDIFQARVAGNLWFLHLHEWFYQRDPILGTVNRVQAGFGGDLPLPGNLGRFAMSVGAALIETLRPDEFRSIHAGLYAGANLKIVVSRFENELRLSWVILQDFALDPEYMADLDFGKIWSNAHKGIFAYNRTFFRAIQMDSFVLGPELKMVFDQMPDRNEFIFQVGFRGQWRI